MYQLAVFGDPIAHSKSPEIHRRFGDQFGLDVAYEKVHVKENEFETKVRQFFLDGGHDYSTVKNDLNQSKKIISQNGTILCDDYNLSYAPGVKKAIDEYVKINNFKCEILLNSRFAKINKY